MDSNTEGEKLGAQRRTTVVQVGALRLAGASAVAALLVLALLIAGLVVLSRPSPGMALSAILWVAFLVYWNKAASKSAPARSSEPAGSRRLHQHLLSASLLLLFIPVPGLRLRYLPISPFLVPAGLALQAGSFLLAVWARRHLGRNWSGAITVKVDHQLVVSGPYRLVRHPIYTAMLGMGLGTAVVSGQLHALLAFAIMLGAYARKVPLEERTLGEAFGGEYEAYRRKTWALIPGLL